LRISANPLLLFIKTSYNIRMKTAMELALARIELMKDISPDSIHWEMFKNDCMEKEKEQIKRAFEFGIADAYNFIDDDAEQYYNQTYNQP